jgi:hypothetical protein
VIVDKAVAFLVQKDGKWWVIFSGKTVQDLAKKYSTDKYSTAFDMFTDVNVYPELDKK